MARSQASATKKEKEKKKLQKRKDKEQRKEERKANAKDGNNLDEMMAYVDENGNISSTPPDPLKKRVISQNDIPLGPPKNDGSRINTLHTGVVTFFNASKGYGFIKDDQTRDSLFVHTNSLKTPIKENDRVSYTTERGVKGMAAVNVKKV